MVKRYHTPFERCALGVTPYRTPMAALLRWLAARSKRRSIDQKSREYCVENPGGRRI